MSDSVASIFLRFLRIGVNAWGGPVAQIGMLREELVEREGWVDLERFHRVMSIYQALPGPEAHELCVYLGYVRRGRIGGLAAGLGFMLPGLALMLAFSIVYVQIGVTSAVAVGLFAGFAPAVAALVLRAVRRIGGHALGDRWAWAIAAATAAATLLDVHFAISLLGGGAIYALAQGGRRMPALAALIGCAVLLGWVAAVHAPATDPVAADRGPAPSELREPGLGEVATTGLRAGLLTFGGAYTAIPFIEHDAVTEGRWLTRSQFLDGLAIATSLPAPLIIFATFVGYLGGGIVAALLITVMIFAPAFAFTLVGHDRLERLVEDPRAHAVLDGVTAAVVGLMAVIAVSLTLDAVDGLLGIAVLGGALVALRLWNSRASIAGVMLTAGAIGVAAELLG